MFIVYCLSSKTKKKSNVVSNIAIIIYILRVLQYCIIALKNVIFQVFVEKQTIKLNYNIMRIHDYGRIIMLYMDKYTTFTDAYITRYLTKFNNYQIHLCY
jgi:hypothetical protein